MTSSPRAAFRYRDFRLYQGARAASILAAQMQTVAIGWQVYALTDDPLHLGYTGLAQFVPFILLSLVGGHTADRHDRRGLLIVSHGVNAASSLALFALVALEVRSVWP